MPAEGISSAARVLCLVFPVCVAGCDDQPDVSTPSPGRDSAGITIVENPAGAIDSAPRWNVGPEPLVEIGSVDGAPEYVFGGVSNAVRLSDGRIVVATGSPPELRVYDSRGAFERSVGGDGEGPGEFRSLYSLDRLRHDSLIVFDSRLNRVSYFGPDVRFTESIRLGGRPGTLVGRLTDGSYVTHQLNLFGGREPEGVHRAESMLYSYAPDGTLRDTLLIRPDRRLHVIRRDGRVRAALVPLVWTSLHAAADTSGLYTARSDEWEYQVRHPDGSVERIVRLDRERQPVTDSQRDSLLERRLAHIQDAERRRTQARTLEAIPPAERHPAFDRMLLDGAGNLWLREPEWADPSADRWIVFAPDGRVRAVARLPARFLPTDIGRDLVVGRWRDPLDVSYVRMYELRKSR